ncbi:hypothetical protein M408DRAFT_327165 [Serendipita vermifera MAFF 305830]|uniref:Uncharacterized protein n=1 Tax=Serendipita vermifera MAFF 305830 TaxID=933852 RepID=A0A0C3BJR2_SERVB|nr:hypothetical protein M408DRAFT_327165 [Serendipita vermifera MAFF 305830]
MAEPETTEVDPKREAPAETGNVISKQEDDTSGPTMTQNEASEHVALPERPRSRSPAEAVQSRASDRRESPGRQARGGRGRRKPPPPYRGRGPPGRPSRPSPGPPPMPPPGPPPAGYRRPERLDSPPPHRRGRSPVDTSRRRSPTPPRPPPVPPSSSYGRSRYDSPPRRPLSPPSRRWSNVRSRSPPPRGYRSPPGSRWRRSPMRSPPPRRRSPPGPYRRPPSRSPPYKRPYSPRRSSPGRRSPPRTGTRTRTVSPQPVKHRLPSPSRSAARGRFAQPVRSNTNSRRGSPSARDQSPNGHRKRTRSPDKGDTVAKEEDDHVAKKRRTMDGEPPQEPRAGSPMRGVKRESDDHSMPYSRFDGASENRPPTEPKSFREMKERESGHGALAILRIKTEQRDVEMADGTAHGSPADASPTTWKTPKTPAPKQSISSGQGASASQTNQPPPTPTATVPKMPTWKKESITPDLDAEIERVRALRLSISAEHTNITTAVRRALYELELVDFDLKASEARLAVAEKQSELAAKGMPIYVEDNTSR